MANIIGDCDALEHIVRYDFAVGAEVAFAKRAGVARGRVQGVEISVIDGTYIGHPLAPRSETKIRYRIAVRNATPGRSERGHHIEIAPADCVFRTLDEAWKRYERGDIPEAE